jgi:hypothetical protein
VVKAGGTAWIMETIAAWIVETRAAWIVETMAAWIMETTFLLVLEAPVAKAMSRVRIAPSGLVG